MPASGWPRCPVRRLRRIAAQTVDERPPFVDETHPRRVARGRAPDARPRPGRSAGTGSSGRRTRRRCATRSAARCRRGCHRHRRSCPPPCLPRPARRAAPPPTPGTNSPCAIRSARAAPPRATTARCVRRTPPRPDPRPPRACRARPRSRCRDDPARSGCAAARTAARPVRRPGASTLRAHPHSGRPTEYRGRPPTPGRHAPRARRSRPRAALSTARRTHTIHCRSSYETRTRLGGGASAHGRDRTANVLPGCDRHQDLRRNRIVGHDPWRKRCERFTLLATSPVPRALGRRRPRCWTGTCSPARTRKKHQPAPLVVFFVFSGTLLGMRTATYDRIADLETGSLMTTGEAATLLNSSRQHVVDLCERGELPFTTVGTHRRIRRADIEALRSRTERLTRDQRRSLWLQYAVAGRVVADPQRARRLALRNLDRMRSTSRGQARRWLDEWERLLEGPIDDLLAVLVSPSPKGRELRQNSPFSGLLDEDVWIEVLDAWKARDREVGR